MKYVLFLAYAHTESDARNVLEGTYTFTFEKTEWVSDYQKRFWHIPQRQPQPDYGSMIIRLDFEEGNYDNG
jgi:hypothetical protein